MLAPNSSVSEDTPADPQEAAENAGLTYVSDLEPGIRRKKCRSGFGYFGVSGTKIHDKAILKRIRKLAIPPAWTDVWICSKSNGHLQATGRDAKGRKQYRYHPAFREVRDTTKYEHIVEFAKSLPAIRAKVKEHMGLNGLSRDKVLATIVDLMEATLIRVGNDSYAKENKSYGLTTLRNRHVAVNGSELMFHFKGKGGKIWRLQVRDRRIAKIVRACQELPGQELFQYFDESGELKNVTSSDVNSYLREITGRKISAKISGHGTAPFWPRLRCTRLRASRAKRRSSGISRQQSSRWRRGSATPSPYAGSATCTRRSCKPMRKGNFHCRSKTKRSRRRARIGSRRRNQP